MKNLRVALIGCGRIAGHHCRSIVAVDGIELAAVSDLEIEKAEAYSREFNVPAFVNYRAMMAEISEIDLVAVITPSGMHHEHGLEIIRDYGKSVIMEKPTFMCPEQLNDSYAAADETGVKIFPVFQNRYNKAIIRVKKALEQSELGEVRLASVCVRWCRPQRYYDLAPWRGTFSHDGGCLTNQGAHHVDLLLHLVGKIKRVNATMRTLGTDIEVEDTVVATLEFESGALGSLEVTTAARPDDFEASLSIVGSEGLAHIGGIAVNQLELFTPDPEACVEHSEDFVGIEGHGAIYGFGHAAMYRHIVADFTGKQPYPIDREDALATLALLHAFYRSDEKGDWVDVSNSGESVRLGRAGDEISKLYRTPFL